MLWRQMLSGVCLEICLFAGVAQAQETGRGPIVTDRPDFTESAETVPQGMVQVEGGYTFARGGDEKEQSFGEVLVRVATGAGSELRFGVPSYVRLRRAGDTASGFEDAFIGAKFVLSKGSGQFGFRKPATALLVHTTLPTGSSGFGEDKLQPDAVLALAVDLSERLSLASNLGYAYASDNGDRFSQFFGSVALGYGISERVGTYAEVFGFSKVGPGESGAKYVNGGVTYLVNNDFQLDARLGVGVNNDVSGPDYFFGIGAARRF